MAPRRWPLVLPSRPTHHDPQPIVRAGHSNLSWQFSPALSSIDLESRIPIQLQCTLRTSGHGLELPIHTWNWLAGRAMLRAQRLSRAMIALRSGSRTPGPHGMVTRSLGLHHGALLATWPLGGPGHSKGPSIRLAGSLSSLSLSLPPVLPFAAQ